MDEEYGEVQYQSLLQNLPNTNDLSELNNLVWKIFDDTNKIMKHAEAVEYVIPGSET